MLRILARSRAALPKPALSMRSIMTRAAARPFLGSSSLFRGTSFALLRRSVSSGFVPSPITSQKNWAESRTSARVEEYFGVNVYDRRAMKETLSADVFDTYCNAVANGQSVDHKVADAIAKALLRWAQARGATHFTHWFQPLTGTTAEKHDTFLDTLHDGETPITRFRGKDLIMGEPDGSSFPSGGLRVTHTARGYTAWDPTSPPFVLEHGNGATLYIPACFFSWKDNQALDDKTVLLRASNALRREALRLFKLMGDHSHTSIHTDSGLEQEFFLIDRQYYVRRPDLVVAGRTVVGSAPPKGQELEDQYFGHKSQRFLDAIHTFEKEMWKLGVPIMTRHREVAPGQYEVAPRFALSNVATDRNLIAMEVLKKSARKHGLAAILHEKPFKGVNGSGKHNNWSFGTNKVPSVLTPGDRPEANTQFMLFLAATIRAVDMHGDLLRWSICGAGNDHRLGANEAPPAIISAYLGDDIADAVEKFIKGDTTPSKLNLKVDLGVPVLPPLHRAATDRNRTSPFAFTGNKFEFRAVGASQTPSRSNMVLNTLLADSLRAISDELEAFAKKGVQPKDAIPQIARQLLQKHKRVIFNGNGYSAEWHAEAERRGLPNLRTTPDALSQLIAPKNFQLFQSLGVLSKDELESRFVIGHVEYCHKLAIEARVLYDICFNQVIPAAVAYQRDLAASVAQTQAVLGEKAVTTQRNLLTRIAASINRVIDESETLHQKIEEAEKLDGPVPQARFFQQTVIPIMDRVRADCDELEQLLPHDKWPLPSYHEMLHVGQE